MPDPAMKMKKMHLPLPPDLHARLKEESEASGTPSTVLAREAVEEWLERRRRERVAEDIRAYAREMAGTDADLDEDLEEAGIDAWLEHDR